MLLSIGQLLFILTFPYLTYRVYRQRAWPQWLSPVVLCYAAGMLVRNFQLWPVEEASVILISEISIVLAIPLLLFSTQVRKIYRQAGPALVSFLLCVASGLIGTSLATALFYEQHSESWKIAGMLTGIYTGGTPNLQAVGLALETEQSTIILVNAADVLLGSIYLLFLIALGPTLLQRLLPDYTRSTEEKEADRDPMAHSAITDPVRWQDRSMGLLLAAMAVGLALGLSWLVYGQPDIVIIILGITTISILFSFLPRIRQLPGTYDTGEYLLLIFCVALGLLADFRHVLAQGVDLLLFTAVALYTTALLHLLFAYLFRIDRDTFLFSTTAAIYGPAFIGQMAAVTGNRQLILAGVSLGLLGYALGNYLGISLAYLLRWIMGG